MSDTEANEIFAATLPEAGIDLPALIAFLGAEKGVGTMVPFVVAEEDDPCVGYFVEQDGPHAAIATLIGGDMLEIFLTTKQEIAGPLPEKEPRTRAELEAYFANAKPLRGLEFASFLKEIHEDPDLQAFLTASAQPAPIAA